MPLAMSTKFYAQYLGMDVSVKNTFLDFAKDSEPQHPAGIHRSQSCPPKVGSSPVEPGSEEKQELRRGRQTYGNSMQGSNCAAKDESPASMGVPSFDLPEMPEHIGAEDQVDRFPMPGSSCTAKDESPASMGVPSFDLLEMPEHIGAEGQADRFPDAGCQQQLRGRRMQVLPTAWRWPQQAAPAKPAARRLAPEVVSPAPATQAQPLNEACLMSIGSRQHAEGSCKPCYFYLMDLCRKGQECTHCHMPHDAPMWKRPRAPKHVRERVKKAAVAAAASGGIASAAGHEDVMNGVRGHAAYHPSQPFMTARAHCVDSTQTASVIPDLAR